MENVSSGKQKSRMDLLIEHIAGAIREWVEAHPGQEKRDAVRELSEKTGVSARTIESIKNYHPGMENRPNPRLDNLIAIIEGIGCKAIFYRLHDFEKGKK